jgi:hypothetical protein
VREKRKREHSAAFPLEKEEALKSLERGGSEKKEAKRDRGAFLLLSFSPHLRVCKCFI